MSRKPVPSGTPQPALRRVKRFLLPALGAAVFWAVFCMIPYLFAPSMAADGWQAAAEAHAADAVRDGELPVAYGDPASVVCRVTRVLDGGGFRVVRGTVTTDRDASPFQLLLRRQPLGLRYICLCHWHADQPVTRLGGVDWWLGTYDIARDAGGLTVTGQPRGLVLLLLLEGAVGVLLRLRRKADGAAAPPQENP